MYTVESMLDTIEQIQAKLAKRARRREQQQSAAENDSILRKSYGSVDALITDVLKSVHSRGPQVERPPRSTQFQQYTPAGSEREEVAKTIHATHQSGRRDLSKLFDPTDTRGNQALQKARRVNGSIAKAHRGMLSKAVTMPPQNTDMIPDSEQVYADTGGTRPSANDNMAGFPTGRPSNFLQPQEHVENQVGNGRSAVPAEDAAADTESGQQDRDSLEVIKDILRGRPKTGLFLR